MILFELKNIASQSKLPPGCIAFGRGASRSFVKQWLSFWSNVKNDFSFVLILAGSRTAELEGISAAGATSASRKFTAVADAELLLNGPGSHRKFALPPLDGGVSPALISYVSSRFIGVDPIVVSVGLPCLPEFPHLRLEPLVHGPANCVSTGKAMDQERVRSLWDRGFSIGRKLSRPLVLAECVPGGTTTAQAVLTGLGLSVSDLISGSSVEPPRDLKTIVVGRGLKSANFQGRISPYQLLAAIGDPFQPVAVGLLLGARQSGQQVVMAGGSQMVAVLAMALWDLNAEQRRDLVSRVVVGTTAWLATENSSSLKKVGNLELLLDRVGEYFGVNLLGLSTGLRFHTSTHKELRDYERGYVKEGVGAGALALLAQVNGISCNQLVDACDSAIEKLEGTFSEKSID